MSRFVFEIEELECAYGDGVPVLHIPGLALPKGRFIFIVGKSGIGKSTLIETLGLMNKTIRPGSRSRIFFHPDDEGQVSLPEIWKTDNQQLSTFRRRHFSFIFQSTNLMPNFSCGENMIFSLLIKGVPYEPAKAEVLRMMDRIALAPEIFDKKITEVSGGQRQRLAFVRAITADHTVLLGDEPTGNLDNGVARELMSILAETIKEKGSTGIIVSHDLELANQFADVIIPITEKVVAPGKRPSGIIEDSNVIYRNDGQWRSSEGNEIGNIHSYLNQFLSAAEG